MYLHYGRAKYPLSCALSVHECGVVVFLGGAAGGGGGGSEGAAAEDEAGRGRCAAQAGPHFRPSHVIRVFMLAHARHWWGGEPTRHTRC